IRQSPQFGSSQPLDALIGECSQRLGPCRPSLVLLPTPLPVVLIFRLVSWRDVRPVRKVIRSLCNGLRWLLVSAGLLLGERLGELRVKRGALCDDLRERLGQRRGSLPD